MGSVCRLLEGPELEALAPEIARKLGLGLRWVCAAGRGVVGEWGGGGGGGHEARLLPCPPLACSYSPLHTYLLACPPARPPAGPPACSDNWSQVRYAASTATRAFMLCAAEPCRERVFPLVLPHMCLNRWGGAAAAALWAGGRGVRCSRRGGGSGFIT